MYSYLQVMRIINGNDIVKDQVCDVLRSLGGAQVVVI